MKGLKEGPLPGTLGFFGGGSLDRDYIKFIRV